MHDPVDPDVSLAVPQQRRELRDRPGTVLGVIALGGASGALARYTVGALLPHQAGQWAWSTLLINVSGCLAIGVLMALIEHVWPRQRLLRPFLGVGVLGGYTTFSTATLDVVQLVDAHRPAPALLYLGGTALAALAAVALGSLATTALLTRPAAEGELS
ncbi:MULTISPECIES: fluoride efflux transporter CrcB [Amycolatopsis]|uniref:Fluoride-specific ion channel FluC n=2 Tax=Amycolatopsis TaxID=1813 RepID=A0A1I3KEC5_9PSEU|nr:fluoride efflux transporter CrcB [Amycolatopsis sacchari]SFI70842.1 CrcB protein [Amycolatopsis sacchari]